MSLKSEIIVFGRHLYKKYYFYIFIIIYNVRIYAKQWDRQTTVIAEKPLVI